MSVSVRRGSQTFMPPALNVEAPPSPPTNLDQDELNRRIRAYFDRYACIYDSYHWYFHNVYLQRWGWREIKDIRRHVGGRLPTVLDLGCGTGNLAIKFLNCSFDVTGVDISHSMLQMLQ